MVSKKGVETMLQVGMISKWHVHAEGYAKTVQDTGKAQIAAVWDDDEERGKNGPKSWDVPITAI